MTPVRVTPQNGYAIRAFREREGLKIADLAGIVRVSEPHMRNIENEHRPASPEHLARISDALNVPIAALVRVPASEFSDGRKTTRHAVLAKAAESAS